MQETALRKGQQPCEGLTLCRGWIDKAAAAQPDAWCTKRGAERLMPPATPEPRHALVEHVGSEAAVDTGIMPQLGARAKNARAKDEMAKHLPECHDEVDGNENGREADESSIGKQDKEWKRGERGRECLRSSGGDLCGQLRAEYEIRVFHHENGEDVQRKVLDEHGHDFDTEPLPTCLVPAKALTCPKRDGCEVDCRARERLLGLGKTR